MMSTKCPGCGLRFIHQRGCKHAGLGFAMAQRRDAVSAAAGAFAAILPHLLRLRAMRGQHV